MKKRIFSALLAAAMVVSLAACGSTPASTGGSGATSGGDAAPASGGEVVVYSPNSDTEVNAVIPAFEAATGIRVNYSPWAPATCWPDWRPRRPIPRPT